MIKFRIIKMFQTIDRLNGEQQSAYFKLVHILLVESQ